MGKSKQKPLVFVGSSVERLELAQAVQSNLEPHYAQVNVWPARVFKPGDVGIDSLLEQVKACDFGVFICAADDLVTRRGERYKTVRDNVIFELGLFMGRLGRKRAFIVIPSGVKLHLPSDLDGVNPVKFDASRTDNVVAAMGSACNEIRARIAELGRFRETPDELLSVAKTIAAPPPFPAIKGKPSRKR
jgi:predicted nucleotide-binding protein